jgi:hypothetical protein
MTYDFEKRLFFEKTLVFVEKKITFALAFGKALIVVLQDKAKYHY